MARKFCKVTPPNTSASCTNYIWICKVQSFYALKYTTITASGFKDLLAEEQGIVISYVCAEVLQL
jgi:hypothetical protein